MFGSILEVLNPGASYSLELEIENELDSYSDDSTGIGSNTMSILS